MKTAAPMEGAAKTSQTSGFDSAMVPRIATALFVLLALTGGVLMFYFRPLVGLAWTDVVDLREVHWAGSWRKLHYWAAQVVIIVLWLQLLRMFLAGEHLRRRAVDGRRRWFVAVALLALSVAAATTGSLLPQTKVETSVESTHSVSSALSGTSSLVASPEAGSNRRLLGIYVLHCLIFPLLIGGAVVYRRSSRDASNAPSSEVPPSETQPSETQPSETLPSETLPSETLPSEDLG